LKIQAIELNDDKIVGAASSRDLKGETYIINLEL
jgi:hypothetical protein